MRKRLLYAMFMAAAVGCSTRQNASEAFHPLEVGQVVPPYAVETLSGDTVHIGPPVPTPPTVLNVWATWCASCREEMATLDSLNREYKARGLRVIAVSVDDGDGERVKRFAASAGLGMTVAHDPGARIENAYRVVGVPTTFIVDASGKLVWQHTGNLGPVLSEARSAVREAMSK